MSWKATRAKVVLWVRNYNNAVRLGRSKPHLPEPLGGLDMAVGACDSFDSKVMRDHYVPYWAAMLKLEKPQFLKYQTLLSGIYRANPKGFAWENDEEIIAQVVSRCETVDEKEVFKQIPLYLSNKPIGDKLRFINHELGLITVRQIADELARREAFLSFWKNKLPSNFMTLKLQNARQRHDDVWRVIRKELTPCEPEWHINSFNKLKTEFELRTWGLYVRKEDPAIAEAFEGTPSLYLNMKNSIHT